MEGISEGRDPLRKLDLRLKILRASSFPIVFNGIGPNRPWPGRWIAITRVPSSLQVMPTQEEQMGSVEFQFSFLTCGTAEANWRSAWASDFKSAVITQRLCSRKRMAAIALNRSFIVDGYVQLHKYEPLTSVALLFPGCKTSMKNHFTSFNKSLLTKIQIATNRKKGEEMVNYLAWTWR